MPNVFDQAAAQIDAQPSATQSGGGNVFEQAASQIDQKNSPPGMLTRGMGAILNVGEQAKGFVKQGLRTADNVANMLTLGADRQIQKNLPSGIPGQSQYDATQSLLTPRNDMQRQGASVEGVAEMLAPIPGVEEIKAAKGAGTLAKAGYGALRGAIDAGTRSAAQSGDVSDAPAGAVGGAVVGGLLESIPGPLGKLLKWAARKQYGMAVGPVGKAARTETRNLLLNGTDDLVDKGVMAFTKKGLESKFTGELAKSNKQLEKAYQALGPNAKLALNPILKDMAAFVNKNAFLPNGNVGSPELITQAVKMTNRMATAFGGLPADIPLADARAFRQMLDKEIFKSKLNVNPETAADTIKKAWTDSIRQGINSQNPSVAEFNNKSHFWQQATKILSDSIDSGEGKEAFLRQLGTFARPLGAAVTGGVLGYAHGGTNAERLRDASAFAALGAITGSTGWRTVSAVAKDRIADAIAHGATQYALNLATRYAGRGMVRTTKPFTNQVIDKATTPISAMIGGPNATLRGAVERANAKDELGPEAKKNKAVVATRQILDATSEEAAGVLDSVQTPIGILTAGVTPAVKALTKIANPQTVQAVTNALKVIKFGTNLGFTTNQVQQVAQAVNTAAKNPTAANLAHVAAQTAIVAGGAARLGRDVKNDMRIPPQESAEPPKGDAPTPPRKPKPPSSTPPPPVATTGISGPPETPRIEGKTQARLQKANIRAPEGSVKEKPPAKPQPVKEVNSSEKSKNIPQMKLQPTKEPPATPKAPSKEEAQSVSGEYEYDGVTRNEPMTVNGKVEQRRAWVAFDDKQVGPSWKTGEPPKSKSATAPPPTGKPNSKALHEMSSDELNQAARIIIDRRLEQDTDSFYMPWTSKSASRFTKRAKSAKSKRQWSRVANSVLRRGGSEGSAVRMANGVVKKRKSKRTRSRS